MVLKKPWQAHILFLASNSGGGVEETCFHFFFECPFSTDSWQSLSVHWNLNLQPLDMMTDARTPFSSSIFREIMIVAACWIIWTVRNEVVFDNKSANLQAWKEAFNEELGLVCIKAKQKISRELSLWRDNLS
jgi:hypothetical protein